MKLELVARDFVRLNGGGLTTARATSFESLAVAQVEGYNSEAARAGRRFIGGNNIIANGIAPVSAIPTTTATLALYNSAPESGRSLHIDRITFWLGSGTAAAGATLFGTVSPSAIAAAPTAMATGYTISSASGSTNSSYAIFTTAATVPVLPAAPAWIALSSSFQAAAANVGQGDGSVEYCGGIIVPPKRALCLGILSGAGTSPLYGISIVWNEFE